MEKELLRPGDIAEALSVSKSRVYQLFRAGELPVTRIGGAFVVPRAAWQRWLEEHAERALAGVRRT